jgi:hypothetical protein
VLQAIGFALPEVGYCQGMNFIASTLISSVGNDEELAFWIFMNLLITRDMKTLFLPVSVINRIKMIFRECQSYI